MDNSGVVEVIDLQCDDKIEEVTAMASGASPAVTQPPEDDDATQGRSITTVRSHPSRTLQSPIRKVRAKRGAHRGEGSMRRTFRAPRMSPSNLESDREKRRAWTAATQAAAATRYNSDEG